MALRSLSSSIFLLSSRASRALLRVPALPRSSPLLRLRPLVPLAEGLAPSGLLRASSTRCFSSSRTASSLNDPSPNWSNRPPKETILLDGCDFEHWLVVVEPPDQSLTRDEIIKSYIKTLAQVVGSEEEARFKIYSVSTKHYFAFGALVSEELSYKIKELPGVRWVLPDSYLNVKEKDYGGEPFINGEAVPYDPKYHEEWVRNNARANERNRRNDRPRNSDRSRNFERRRENMQNFQNRAPPPMYNQGVGNPAGQNSMPGQNLLPPQGPGHALQNASPPANAPNMGAPQNAAPPPNAPNLGAPQSAAPPTNAPNLGTPQTAAPPTNSSNVGGPNHNFGGYQNQNPNYQNNMPNPYQVGPNNAYQGPPRNSYQGAPGNAYQGGPGYQGGSNAYQGGPTGSGYQGHPLNAPYGGHPGYQGAPNTSHGGHPGYQGAPNASQGNHSGYHGAPNGYQGNPGSYQSGAGYQGPQNSYQGTSGPAGSQQPRDVPGRD